jgi:hypothetical protein
MTFGLRSTPFVPAKRIGAKLSSSLPGLTRQSIPSQKLLAKKMDARASARSRASSDALLPAHDCLRDQPQAVLSHFGKRR